MLNRRNGICRKVMELYEKRINKTMGRTTINKSGNRDRIRKKRRRKRYMQGVGVRKSGCVHSEILVCTMWGNTALSLCRGWRAAHYFFESLDSFLLIPEA